MREPLVVVLVLTVLGASARLRAEQPSQSPVQPAAAARSEVSLETAEPTAVASASTPSGHAADDAAPPARLRDGVHSIEGALVLYQLTRPGAQIGYSHRLVETHDRQHALAVGADLGAFLWPQREVGVFVLPRVAWRGRFDFGLQVEVAFRIGLLHSIPASTVYTVDAARGVEGHVSAGYSFLEFGPALGLGWAFRELGLVPFVRAGAVWVHPVFDQSMLRLDLTIGAEVMIP